MGSTFNEFGGSIAVDISGNVYTTGSYTGNIDMDPGPPIFNLSPSGAFISKLDSSGNFVWAKKMGDRGHSITVDIFGNVYTIGLFSNTQDFDPNIGYYPLTASVGAPSNIFISKLDSSGNFVWAKNIGRTASGTFSTPGQYIAVDKRSNVYTTGHFQGIADFDPNVGVYNLISTAIQDIFVSKLDSSGNFVWAKSFEGTGGYFDEGRSIHVDKIGNVYTTGTFSGTVDLNPGPGIMNFTANGPMDMFISRLDSFGNFIWGKTIGGTNSTLGFSIVTDNTGNVYTTGFFQDTVDFDPNSGGYNLPSNGFQDIFILKLNQQSIFGQVYHDFNQNCNQE